MSLTLDLDGDFADRCTPEWQPLEDLVGEELAGWFMWMFALDMEDGTVVHAYKHIMTRRYFHISEQGRTFLYTREGRYRPISRRAAIKEAFESWRRVTEADERATVAAELKKAVRRASPVAR